MASEKETKIVSLASKKAGKRETYNRSTYGEIIRANRIRKGINQPQLATILGTTKNNVYNWEAGFSRPDMNLIPELCKTLGITITEFFGETTEWDAFTPAQREHMRGYARLTQRDQSAVNALTNHLLYMADADLRARCIKEFRSVFHNDNMAAAGSANMLGDSVDGESEFLRRDAVSERADEIITVTGDSMEPTFYEGDDLMVEHTETLDIGEIGIFIINGEGFVKEYQGNGVYSHNTAAYPFRVFFPDDNVRIVGRVLGKVTKAYRPTREEAAMLDELRFEGSI